MSDLRSKMIRLAATMPKGSSERTALLDVLKKKGAMVPPSPLDLFWAAMKKHIPARPKEVDEGRNQIHLQWMEGPGIAPYVTIEIRRGQAGADVDGQWLTDPRKAGRAVNDWIDLLTEEAGW